MEDHQGVRGTLILKSVKAASFDKLFRLYLPDPIKFHFVTFNTSKHVFHCIVVVKNCTVTNTLYPFLQRQDLGSTDIALKVW